MTVWPILPERPLSTRPSPSTEREFLLDVSRLVWRVWRGGHPTGIDRVCLAYLEHFGLRSQAVVQRRGVQLVLSPKHSDRLFEILRTPGPSRQLDLLALAAIASPSVLRTRARRGAIYLNVGHTGLNETSLPRWIARNRLRAVYLIHDLIPLTHPQFCRDGEADRHSIRMQNVLASAAGVIGNSQATLDEFYAFAREVGAAPPPSTVALISGCPAAHEAAPRKLPRPHFVALGTIEGRKNHELLLNVWRSLVAELGQMTPILLIIGRRGWKAEQVFSQLDRLGELQGHVQEISDCEDEELEQLVAGARALLMPSFAEGFGLPVIEALPLGTPVIATDLAVYREIAGSIPAFLDPNDAAAWKRTITAYAGEDPDRKRQLAAARTYKAPDWPAHFANVEVWLSSLAADDRSLPRSFPISV